MKYFFILNPGSRGGKSKVAFRTLQDALNKEGVDYDYHYTHCMEDAFQSSVSANRAGYDVIVAVGGDGTINRVINGFYDKKGHRISSAKMGVIYAGTSPDFCKSYHIPCDVKNAIRVLLKGYVSKVGIGQITFARRFISDIGILPEQMGSDFDTRYFGCCANFGLGASLARFANSGIRKMAGDFLGTFLSLGWALLLYHPNRFRICRDGKHEVIENVHSISIGKTFYIASGIKVNHALKGADKRLYHLVIKDLDWWNLPNCLYTIYSGKRFDNNHVSSLQYSHSVEISGNNRNPEIEFDGDPAGFLPCRIETAEDPLDLIVDNAYGK